MKLTERCPRCKGHKRINQKIVDHTVGGFVTTCRANDCVECEGAGHVDLSPDDWRRILVESLQPKVELGHHTYSNQHVWDTQALDVTRSG